MFKIVTFISFFLLLANCGFAQVHSATAVSEDSVFINIHFGRSIIRVSQACTDRVDWARLIQTDSTLVNYFKRAINNGEFDVRITGIEKVSKLAYNFQIIFIGLGQSLIGIGYRYYYVAVDDEIIQDAKQVWGIKYRHSEL